MPSSLLASCRRSISLHTNCSTVPSSTLRKSLIICQGRSCGGPWGASVLMNEPCKSSRACTPTPGDVCGSMVSTVRSLAWELVCIKALSLAHCSSSCNKKCFHASSTLVCWWPGDHRRLACISKLKAWKTGTESKRFHINMKKTKLMFSGVGLNVLKNTDKYSSAICCHRVDSNSICSQYKLWVHNVAALLVGWRLTLKVCPRCRDEAHPIDGRPVM